MYPVVLHLGEIFLLTPLTSLQQCQVTAHSLLGVHKDGVGTLIRSMGLADRVSYVRGDPSYVPLSSPFLFTWYQRIAVGEICTSITLVVRLTWCGCHTAL